MVFDDDRLLQRKPRNRRSNGGTGQMDHVCLAEPADNLQSNSGPQYWERQSRIVHTPHGVRVATVTSNDSTEFP